MLIVTQFATQSSTNRQRNTVIPLVVLLSFQWRCLRNNNREVGLMSLTTEKKTEAMLCVCLQQIQNDVVCVCLMLQQPAAARTQKAGNKADSKCKGNEAAASRSKCSKSQRATDIMRSSPVLVCCAHSRRFD